MVSAETRGEARGADARGTRALRRPGGPAPDAAARAPARGRAGGAAQDGGRPAGRADSAARAGRHRPGGARGGRRRQASCRTTRSIRWRPRVSATVPMLIGSTLNEFANEIQTPGIEAITEQELQRAGDGRLRRARGAGRRRLSRARCPARGRRTSSRACRPPRIAHNAIAQATRKRALGAAPAYLYWFTWQTPILDGRPARVPLRRAAVRVRQHGPVCGHDGRLAGGPGAGRADERCVDRLRAHRATRTTRACPAGRRSVPTPAR